MKIRRTLKGMPINPAKCKIRYKTLKAGQFTPEKFSYTHREFGKRTKSNAATVFYNGRSKYGELNKVNCGQFILRRTRGKTFEIDSFHPLSYAKIRAEDMAHLEGGNFDEKAFHKAIYKKGIGQTVMKELERYAKDELGAKMLILDPEKVTEGFYEKQGFMYNKRLNRWYKKL